MKRGLGTSFALGLPVAAGGGGGGGGGGATAGRDGAEATAGWLAVELGAGPSAAARLRPAAACLRDAACLPDVACLRAAAACLTRKRRSRRMLWARCSRAAIASFSAVEAKLRRATRA